MLLSISIATGGLTIVPGRSGPAGTDFSVSLDEFQSTFSATAFPAAADRKFVFDAGLARGVDAAPVVLSGTTDAPDGTVFEARAVDVENGGAETTAWSDFTPTISGSAFSGVWTLPHTAAWMRIEVRVKDSTAPAAQQSGQSNAGHVWAFWEQSNGSKLFNDGPTQDQYEALAAENDMLIVARQTYDGTGDDTDPAAYSLVPVNTSTAIAGTTPVTPAAVAMANALAASRPGEKFLIVAQTQTGTSPYDALVTNAEGIAGTYSITGVTDRDHAVDRAIHTAATGHGTQVGAVFVPGWFESLSGFQNLLKKHAPLYIGREFPSGDKTSIATRDLPRLFLNTYADGSNTDADGHDLRTAYDPDGDAELGGGIYDMSYTKWGFFGPHGSLKQGDGSVNDEAPAAANVTGIADLRYNRTDRDTDHDTLVSDAKMVLTGDNPLFPEALPYVGVTHGGWRESTDILHVTGSVDGRDRLAKLWMFNALKATGLIDAPIPALDLRFDAPDGTYADFGIVGRDVTTERLRRGLDPIAQIGATGGNQDPATGTNTPHRTEVMGWSLNFVALERAEIYTVTQGDVDAGHPGTVGQDVCRVYAPTGRPFTWADRVDYALGKMPEILVAEDYDDKTFLNMLHADMGQPAGLIPALPVQPGTFAIPATTLPTPSLFQTSPALAPQFRTTDSNTAVADASQMFAVIRLSVTSRNVRDLIFGTGNAKQPICFVEPDDTLIIRDGGAETSPAVPVSYGVFKEYRLLFDRVNGVMRISDGEGTTLAENLTTGLTGTFGQAGFMNWLTGGTYATLTANVESIEIWLDQTDDTGSPTYAVRASATSPFYTTGGAIVLNGGSVAAGAI